MTATVEAPAPARQEPRPAVRTFPGPRLRALGSQLLNVYAGLGLLFLFMPIFVIVLFSFNDPKGNYNLIWEGFTLDNWRHPFAVPELLDAFLLSLRVAAIATAVAVAFGALISLSLTRYRFRGSGAVNLLLVLPLTTPEIVMGASLASLFIARNVNRGFTTILIAHIMFCVSFVALTVKARLRGFDWTLEEAATDLGASPWRVFTRVTLPLMLPGILAAALLSFALSLDDFIITLFNAGTEVTFPLFIYGATQRAIPPQIDVLATIVLVVSVTLLALGTAYQSVRARRGEATPIEDRLAVLPLED